MNHLRKSLKKLSLKIILSSLLLLVFLALIAHLLILKNYRLSYQHSESLPQGFYLILPLHKNITRNEILVFTPPPTILPFLESRGWLVPGDWLMKKAMGLPGDWVCIRPNLDTNLGPKLNTKLNTDLNADLNPNPNLSPLTAFKPLGTDTLWINAEPIGPILTQDKNNLPLPHLSFCRKLAHNEYFLMSTYISRSFDSRYFGPVDPSLIKGRAIKL